MKKSFSLLLFIAIAPLHSHAAIKITDNFSVSGFGSASITQSDNKTPLFVHREITDKTCYDCDTIFGLQADLVITDTFNTSIQVVKRPQDDWSDPEIEWAYLAYNDNNWSFKGGRLRLPLFLASEYYYVGQAYTWARPPQEVYDSILGFTFYDGLSLHWDYALSDEAILTISPYYGSSKKYKTELGNDELLFDAERVTGISFDVNGFNFRVHAGYMYADFNMLPEPTYDRLNMYTLGAEYSFKQWLFMSELETDNLQTSWYFSSAYHFDQFTPYLVYGESHHRRKSNNLTAGLRLDLTNSVSINAEWQNIFMGQEDYNSGSMGQFITSPTLNNESKDVQLYTLMLNFVF
ncbi:hypothetical protein [Photobacterium sp.]|uniref:hypothetical protein n=1 Tax=Photobacterium sp. TaxID=660 RepID=UPI00299E8906|nr:hypothetical protein [Photobacterium sp.]MDX1301510.1 hypothetical protein [Photobacterium sp.]